MEHFLGLPGFPYERKQRRIREGGKGGKEENQRRRKGEKRI